MVIQYHPVIGHLYVPNLNARIFHRDSGAYFARTNSLGFRSNVDFEKKGSHRPRVLVFGDSRTAGDGCDNHERFSDLLGEMLDAEVYNYGLSGSGTDQHLLIYEHFAHDVEADLIVLCVSVENIERIKVAYREIIDRTTRRHVLVPKPYFVLDGESLILKHSPVPLTRVNPESVDKQQYYGFIHHPWRHILHLRDVYRSDPRLAKVRVLVSRHFPNLRSQILRASGFQPHADYRSAANENWKLMRAILARFAAQASPTPVMIVPIPTYFYFYDGAAPIYQSLYQSLADPVRNIHVMDLSRPLLQLSQADRRNLCFRYDKLHFSPFGHGQLANLIAGEIRAAKLLHCENVSPVRPKAKFAGPVGKPIYVLGLSCFYHNSAACVVKDGEIVAAAEEERFTRVKNDRRFPQHAANYCLEEAGIQPNHLAAIVYYDNASLTFERLMHTLLAVGSDGKDAWQKILPSWTRSKIHLARIIRQDLRYDGLILQEEHHRSHAASAFYPSPFGRAAILTVDGVGEWATASIGVGKDSTLQLIKQMEFPHSLGLLYSAFTQFTGFEVNEGEYKLMGLAPYGEPRFVDTILNHLVDLKEDGSLELDMEYFAYLSQSTMTNGRFAELFGGPARAAESRITRREMDLARSIQWITEESMLRMARYVHKITGEKNLCLAGGVALNCVANGRLLREGPFDNIWIQPAAGDSGGALGAAFDAYYTYFKKTRVAPKMGYDLQRGSYLGPSFSEDEIRAFLNTHAYTHRKLTQAERGRVIAELLAQGKVVGHFTGRMEFGPRALGSRSILGDARNEEMQVNLNVKIKYRESFRPFAPVVLREKVSEYFNLDKESPYMLLVASVKKERCKPFERGSSEDLLPIVKQSRSDIPAVTHVDYSARIQTVKREDHPEYYDVIRAFEQKTGCAVLVNTSFNVRGEPIVCTPYDAYRCFMRTGMDVLILGDFLLVKESQPPWIESERAPINTPARVASSNDPSFLEELAKMFDRDFLPVAEVFRNNGVRISTNLKRAVTTWVDHPAEQTPKAIFEIPPELDGHSDDPEKIAAAVIRYWSAAHGSDKLQILLMKILGLGLKYPPANSPEEEVSQSVYVMF
jgi:carbamoyltransferase